MLQHGRGQNKTYYRPDRNQTGIGGDHVFHLAGGIHGPGWAICCGLGGGGGGGGRRGSHTAKARLQITGRGRERGGGDVGWGVGAASASDDNSEEAVGGVH